MLDVKVGVKVHFIGIGGIGMSGIAEILLSLGYKVSGSDLASSATTEKLASMGAEVFQGHAKENIKDVTVIVYSSAIDETNPEIIVAKEENIPLMRRAEMLAELMRLKKGIAIGGTHGKTTTTSMLATILEESRYDPTYVIGGIVENLKGQAKVGGGEYLIAEADESDGSFLLYNPIMSAITNIDNDHLDHYKTEENLLEAFNTFANRVPFYGCVSLNAHDEKIVEIISNMKKPYITFGIDDGSVEADFMASNIEMSAAGAKYELKISGKKEADIHIKLPGKHNVLNSLSAISIAYKMNVPVDLIASSIGKFEGVGRRLQILFNRDGLEVIDDYGHHPTEIKATIAAVRSTRADRKLIVIFEPHRFSRTRDCWNDFLHCFNTGDQLYMAPIYPASEKPIEGIDSNTLTRDINSLHPDYCKLMNSIDDMGDVINSFKNSETTVLCLGAGSIGKKIREWVASNG